jgi:hypothetical protein
VCRPSVKRFALSIEIFVTSEVLSFARAVAKASLQYRPPAATATVLRGKFVPSAQVVGGEGADAGFDAYAAFAPPCAAPSALRKCSRSGPQSARVIPFHLKAVVGAQQ